MTTDIGTMSGGATLLFGGDTAPVHRGSAAAGLGPSVFWPEIASLLKSHHATILNLESPLVAARTLSTPKLGPILTGDPLFADFLSDSGVTAVTLANNHIMDAGLEGLTSTHDALRRANILSTGAGPSLASAQEPLLLPTPEGLVRIISVAEGEFSAASARSGGAAPLDQMVIGAQLRDRSSGSSLTIVVYHGGHEGYDLPSPEMMRRCRAFVDAGAAAVVCHHAHVVSGCESYRGAVIAYGLGNLLFDMPLHPNASWNTGALLRLGIASGEVTDWQLLGVEQDMSIPVVRLVSATDRFDEETARKSAIISRPAELAREFRLFCRSSRELYLSRLLALNRIERRLVRWGMDPRWRLRNSVLLGSLNLLECDSHREAASEVLRQELGLSDKDLPASGPD